MKEKDLIIQALNYWKKIDPVTYLGIRSFLDNKIDMVQYTEQLINRKAIVNKSIAYRKYKIFKKKENDENIYRDFYALSPLNAFIEAKIVNLLQENYKIKSSRFYSNLSSTTSSSYMYRYYRGGYKQMENDIFNVLNTNKDLVLNTFDISNFYPSVNNKLILRKLQTNLSGGKENKEIILSFFEKLHRDIKGLPIGPASSRFLGSVALDEVDRILEEKYKNHYFRYVDDIIILSPQNKSGEVKAEIETLLHQEGFNLNQEKYLIGKRKEWFKYHKYKIFDSFKLYFDRLKFYIYLNEKDYNFIKSKFIEAGFNFPFLQMKLDNSEVNPISYFIKKTLSFDNLDNLLRDGKVLRYTLFSEASYFISNYLPTSKYEEKLFSHKINYYFYKLINLYNPTYFNDILKIFENHINDEKKMMLQFLHKKDYHNLLNLPGPAVNFLISYLNETDTKINISKSDLQNEERIDSIIQLAAYDRINLDFDKIENITDNTKLINYLLGKDNSLRHYNNLSYFDELNSLLLRKNNEQIQTYFKSRYSKYEKVYYNTGSSYEYYEE